jgi:hypothetical protein
MEDFLIAPLNWCNIRNYKMQKKAGRCVAFIQLSSLTIHRFPYVAFGGVLAFSQGIIARSFRPVTSTGWALSAS